MQKKILQFSDLHIDCNHEQNSIVLKQIIDKVVLEHEDFDYAIVTGDLVNSGAAECYEFVKDQFLRLKLPVYFLPGNEDDLPLMKKILNFKNLHCHIGLIEKDEIDLFTLDTTVTGSCSGHLSQNSLSALEEYLNYKKRTASFAMIAMHHPPFLTGTKWLDKIKLENMDELIGLLDKYKSCVDILILTGHIHQSIQINDVKLQILSCPAVSKQFTRQEKGPFRFDDSKHCFREIYIETRPSKITSRVITLEL